MFHYSLAFPPPRTNHEPFEQHYRHHQTQNKEQRRRDCHGARQEKRVEKRPKIGLRACGEEEEQDENEEIEDDDVHRMGQTANENIATTGTYTTRSASMENLITPKHQPPTTNTNMKNNNRALKPNTP